MERLYEAEECQKVTDLYPDYFTFDVKTWFSNPNNFAYKEGENIGFAESKGTGNFWVHFCFHTAKGREAIKLTREMVKALYNDTKFMSLVGLIHIENRKARWLIRQVGFTSVGEIETSNGLCKMFIFTRNDLNGI